MHLTTGIYKIRLESIVKLSVFSHFFSEKLSFRSQHTNCVSYYSDVINRCIRVLGNRLSSKTLKPKKSRGMIKLIPPPLVPSRVKITTSNYLGMHVSILFATEETVIYFDRCSQKQPCSRDSFRIIGLETWNQLSMH